MAFGIGRKLKHAWNKHKRDLIGITTFGTSEVGRELSGYNQMKQMEQMADAQARVQREQLELAKQEAGAQVQQTNAGTQEALAKVLRKKSALVKASPTLGQNRGRETLG